MISRIVRAAGTGCGAVAISLASAFPQSTIVGVDLDPFSIARAEGVAASLSLIDSPSRSFSTHATFTSLNDHGMG